MMMRIEKEQRVPSRWWCNRPSVVIVAATPRYCELDKRQGHDGYSLLA